MGTVRIPYLVLRHSGWYWQPSKAIRTLGFQFQTLGTNEQIAVAKAIKLNEAVKTTKRDKVSQPTERTVKWLIIRFQNDHLYTRLAAATKRQYDWGMREIEAWVGDLDLSALTPPAIRAWYHEKRKQNHSMANAMLTTMQALMRFAAVSGAVARSPTEDIEKEGITPRDVVWPDEVVNAFLGAAKTEGRPSMALTVRIGLDTGQRLGDVLGLTWSQYNGAGIELRQGKTKARVNVPVTPELKAALDNAPRLGVQIVINERTRRPYRQQLFSQVFRKTMREAGFPAGEYQFRDLRRTAIIWLSRAGCTPQQIAHVTGHAIQTIHNILRVYCPPDGIVAGEAIKRLVDYRKGRESVKSSIKSV